MLIKKKIRFYVDEKKIKEEISSENGAVLLKINLRCPEIVCPKKDPLQKDCAPFYEKMANAFLHYAKNDLLQQAKNACNTAPDGFMPYSAVMLWEKTLENEKYLSLYFDISVSDGINPPYKQRKTQVWNRSNGKKCRISDFLPKEKIKELSEKYKKQFNKELFVLRETGAEFFLYTEKGYSSVTVQNSVFIDNFPVK